MIQYKLKDKNDIKLFILYMLVCLDRPMTYLELNDILVQDEFISWFDCAECFNELLDSGNVTTIYDGPGQVKYGITEQGKQVSATLCSEISNYIRAQGKRSALRFLNKEVTGTLKTTSENRNDGRVNLNFKYSIKDETLLDLTLIAENGYQAAAIEQNFRADPHNVYLDLLLFLQGKNAEGATF